MMNQTYGANLAELKNRLGFMHWLSPVVNQVFKVGEFDDFLNNIQASGRTDFFGSAKEFSKLSATWSDACLARIPREGPLIIMANHPHGLADGIVGMDFVLRARPDALVVGNRWLAQIPGIRPWLIEVNPFDERQADWGNVSGTRRIINHLKAGGCIFTFPAGEVSNFKLRSLSVQDSPWSNQLVKLARKLKASVLPLNIEGRNSRSFYSLGLINPSLQTSMLLREFYAQRGKVIRLRTGKPLNAEQLANHPDDDEATKFIRLKCELLSRKNDVGDGQTTRKSTTVQATPLIRAANPKVLRAELESLPTEDLLLNSGDFKVFRFLGSDLPHVMREIGRLRELTFRSVSEGTGKDCDVDAFDAWYDQMVLWDDKTEQIVGGYRLGPTDRILPLKGKHGMYTSTLFNFKGDFFQRMDPALEMGRSFIREEYQRRPTSLPLLWRGIGRYVVRFPQYHQLF